MGFQFRGWSDKKWRIMVYIFIVIILIVVFGWVTSEFFGWEWEIWKF